MIIAIVILVVTEEGHFVTIGFWTSTMSPFTRYPLFLMGCYAGELCVRYSGDKVFPVELWPRSIIFGCCCCKPKPFASKEAETKWWSTQATVVSILLLVATIGLGILDKVFKILADNEAGLLGAIWF